MEGQFRLYYERHTFLHCSDVKTWTLQHKSFGLLKLQAW